jgi:hypothetical protein
MTSGARYERITVNGRPVDVTYIDDRKFFVDLDAMAQRVGARAEDLLLIWTSESNLRADLRWPAPNGDASETYSTLMKNVWVPGAINPSTWARLPQMSHAEQLPIIERAVYAPAHAKLGRMLRDTFETYLVNAAQGLLRADGNYNPATPMYVGSNYPDNWTMDNAPAGLKAMLAEGIPLTRDGRALLPRETYDFCKELVARGTLKGYVSLGDLQAFGKRVLSSVALGRGTFASAVENLNSSRSAQASAVQSPAAPSVDHPEECFFDLPLTGEAVVKGASFVSGELPHTSPYKPDFDSSMSTGAPVDTRIATPEGARAKMPKHAGGSSPGSLSWPVVGLGVATAIGVVIALNRK